MSQLPYQEDFVLPPTITYAPTCDQQRRTEVKQDRKRNLINHQEGNQQKEAQPSEARAFATGPTWISDYGRRAPESPSTTPTPRRCDSE